MALNTIGLKNGIKSLMSDMELRNTDAKEEFATRLAALIESFVKTGTVNVTVNTTGSASAQTGTGTGGIT